MQNAQLTLFIPDFDKHLFQNIKSKLPALNLLLNRADKEALTAASYEALLCRLFNIDANSELPIAAITGLIDGLPTQTGYWLRADPVQLQADLSAVYLTGNDFLTLTSDEINNFNQKLAPFLKQDQLTLYTPAATRWYLHASDPIPINTTPLKKATGKNITEFLPTGEKQNYWRKLFTEMQMLLYSSQADIHGLWFWGAGRLPIINNATWQAIWTDDPLLKGLAQLAHINYYALPQQAGAIIHQLTSAQRYLISLSADMSVNPETWLLQLETQWLQPLVTALQKKQLNSLAFYLGDDQVFNINWKTIRYFWRRKT